MQVDEVTYVTYDGVAEIALNRPERRNALSSRPGGTRDQLLVGLRRAEGDSAVGAVLLRGEGPAFSAGGDLRGAAERHTPDDHLRFLERIEEFHHRVRSTALPVVAAVHGYCLGAALDLIASCDLVIAADSATFGLPEGRLGLVGASPLVSIIGRQWAKYLILTGEPIDAHRAREIGLVLSVEPESELLARAQELCRRLARLPRDGVALNKQTVDVVADAGGAQAGRLAGLRGDAVTLAQAALATAPDGRTFGEILDTEGVAGLKAAQAAQYRDNWLR